MPKSRPNAEGDARRARFAAMCERALKELRAERNLAEPANRDRLDAEIATFRDLLRQVRTKH